MTRRSVRVDAQFFAELDAQLRELRGPGGEPSASDFLVIDLPVHRAATPSARKVHRTRGYQAAPAGRQATRETMAADVTCPNGRRLRGWTFSCTLKPPGSLRERAGSIPAPGTLTSGFAQCVGFSAGSSARKVHKQFLVRVLDGMPATSLGVGTDGCDLGPEQSPHPGRFIPRSGTLGW